MPSWTITEPYIDLWVQDEPLAYQPATGPRISFQISYDQRNNTANWVGFGLGPGWNCSWLSYVTAGDVSAGTLYYFTPAGGQQVFNPIPSDPSQFTCYNTTAQLSATTDTNGNPQVSTLIYPTGAEDVYGLVTPHGSYLTQRIDESGRTTTFQYGPYDPVTNDVVRLLYVVDADGKTNSLSYTNLAGVASNLIAKVTDRYGRASTFAYDSHGYLTSVVDVASFTNTFAYGISDGDTNHYWLTNMITPYGPTTFSFKDDNLANSDGVNRSAVVTEANGSHQLFVFRGTTGFMAWYDYPDTENYPANPPAGSFLDGGDNMYYRNSFYWNRQQFDNLPANFLSTYSNWDFTQLSTNDYWNARMQHWNHTYFGGVVTRSLSMEREPSPDGIAEGKMTWYDYPNKPYTVSQGASPIPSLVIKVLPDGSEWYVQNLMDDWGHTTNRTSTYSVGATVQTRTSTFIYSTNQVDLLIAIGPDGVTNAAYVYDSNHQFLAMTDALNQVTTFTYNNNRQLTSTTLLPTGLVSTNIYGADGYLATNYSYAIVGGSTVYFGTDSYTYSQGLVSTHTDTRGVTTTSTWDNLQRLTGIAFPDGTSKLFVYSKLDLAQAVDRMHFTNSYAYNTVRQMTSRTDALGRVTGYGYCECGALSYVTNALLQVTHYVYDNQGNLTSIYYSDSFYINDTYNSVRQMVTRTDSAGTSITNWFNNQGLLCAVSNAFGCVRDLTFDINDQVTNSIDANGLNLVMTYDSLGRVLKQVYPDGGANRFGYSAAGLTAVTNQLGFTNFYAYDPAGRKVFETNANWELMQFQYSPAADLTNLIDGKSQSTKWNYDQYGRVTNKVDAAGNTIFQYGYDPDDRLTNRLTLAKGTTTYRYDPVGNLTNVVYPVNTTLILGYDNLKRLTSMFDAVGSTYYGYNAAGQLLSEDGPWADDTVSYVYTNRLRASLSLVTPNASPWAQGYGYDGAKRLKTLTSPSGIFGYAYDATRHTQVSSLTLPNQAYITNTFDPVARVLSTILRNSTNGVLNSHQYGYDLAGERLWLTNLYGDYRNYSYDKTGQLTNVFAHEANGVGRVNEYLSYTYDAAGNLSNRYVLATTEIFGVNALNELTNEWRSGSTFDVCGTTTSPATNVMLTPNGGVPLSLTPYADNAWGVGVALANGTNTFTAVARDALGRSDTNTVSCFLPLTNSFSYDLNGNLLSDGNRSFAYDDENQLTSVWVTNNWRSDFVYDGKMRRRWRFESAWSGSAWITNTTVRYVYDGNLVIQERDANNLPLVSYARGRDLSGSLQSAGGIGGLLARTDHTPSTINSPLSTSYYHSDGNGNITALIYKNQSIAARYLYDPYGNILSQSGLLAAANLYRFSSKEFHVNSGLVYYLYRFYDSSLQRWLNRDPIQEAGGINLYEFVGNDPVDNIDPFGLLTAVFVGGPSPADAQNPSGNPFGHAAIGFTGQGIYSFGTPEQPGSSFTDFLNNQAKYRDGTVYILDTTPEQEKAMIDYLKKVKKERPHLGRYPDNCAHRTTGALKAGGAAPPDLTRMPHSDSFDLGENVAGNWPSLIGDALNNAGALQISVPKGTTLPANFLTGFNPKP
ncbi:MAG TPA: RHS repeat-associated core domain-containing protein [Candidatus Acidoferrum sp.]|nr:RHS repeat-associated core domain-containing protein [Candidatus Acidoferrum sp.]